MVNGSADYKKENLALKYVKVSDSSTQRVCGGEKL